MAQEGEADVRAVQALIELDAALQRFAGRAADSVAEIRTRCDQMRRRLEDRADDATQAVRRCAAVIEDSGGDADDVGYWRHALAEAREKRDELNRWQRRVDEAHDSFRRAANRLNGMLDHTLRRGRGVLRSKVDLLNEYLAIQVDGIGSGGAAAPAPAEPIADRAERAEALAGFALPAGFQWVPLAQIDLRQELSNVRSPADYRKVAKETMRQGLLRLRAEILPRLADESAHTSDYFGDIDRRNVQDYENGLQRVYDAFFGKDHVQLSRAGTPDTFAVVDGRHRIQLAEELGWDAIPTKVDDGEARIA